MRLDHFVAEQNPSLSRSYVAKLIEAGSVLVNGQTSKPGYRLRTTDTVKMDFDLEQLQQIEPIELPIMYEDDNVVVIDKPTGVISHSRGKYWFEPSVASFIRQLTGQEGDRTGIVHRLDRATSGVMICAKNSETLSYLQKQFSQRKVHKTYIAIAQGHLEPPEAIIDMPIERNPKAPATFRVGANGKPAQTAYKVLRSSDKYDEIELTPQTGRTHQLRVHLKQQGHPIVGDALYAGPEAERLFLHAYKLTISIPEKGKQTFTAPLPIGFKQLLESA
ncbi:MAG TPA: RluA family pseudouridine synthase [Patescibacteria group bacterium]|nr:RluA family pseudouridine synthase [Patescibacteria group bacterium]